MTPDVDPDVTYWLHQASAYLQILGDRGIVDEPEHGVVGNHDTGIIEVRCPSITDRDGMAEVIRQFEQGGFQVDSSTTDDHVEITATSDRLPVPYDEDAPGVDAE